MCRLRCRTSAQCARRILNAARDVTGSHTAATATSRRSVGRPASRRCTSTPVLHARSAGSSTHVRPGVVVTHGPGCANLREGHYRPGRVDEPLGRSSREPNTARALVGRRLRLPGRRVGRVHQPAWRRPPAREHRAAVGLIRRRLRVERELQAAGRHPCARRARDGEVDGSCRSGGHDVWEASSIRRWTLRLRFAVSSATEKDANGGRGHFVTASCPIRLRERLSGLLKPRRRALAWCPVGREGRTPGPQGSAGATIVAYGQARRDPQAPPGFEASNGRSAQRAAEPVADYPSPRSVTIRSTD